MSSIKLPKSPRRRFVRGPLLVGALFCASLLLSSAADAFAARSGGSFGGRAFRNSGGGFNSGSRTGYGRGYSGGSRPSFFFIPTFGWGWGGAGYGGGGGFGSLLVLGVLGIAAFSIVRAVRRHRAADGRGGPGGWSAWGANNDGFDDDEVAVHSGRAYVYRLQVALGRSARGIQERLARFAAEGDTSTEAGLGSLLHQTALELMREKDSIRAVSVDAGGPLSLTNAETKMNGMALAERARFQVERVRAADGNVRRSEAAAEEGKEALEFVVVTLVVATRTPLVEGKDVKVQAQVQVNDHHDLDRVLGHLGAVSSAGLLGLEVIWTPADPNDSLTETDLLTTYPDLRNV